MNENESYEEPLLKKEINIDKSFNKNKNKSKRSSISSTTSTISKNSIDNEVLCKYNFDYEVDNIKDNTEILTSLPSISKFPDEIAPLYYKVDTTIPCYKKNFIKKLVSENRVRLQNHKYDLDLVYITKRVLAMSFPASGCESFYRNSYSDVLRYFREEYGDDFKIYNLCREPSRIYPSSRFPSVALFPFDDHQCCPIKLMLEFCVDVSLYLLRKRNGVAAVHCKAGKGRTGTMICAYMIFTGLANNAEKSFDAYGSRRSYINRGVTVPSQRRYIQHFEAFLAVNFIKPYYKLIPKIYDNIISFPNGNLLNKLLFEQDYYDFGNTFLIKRITIGPFQGNAYPHIRLVDFKHYILFDSSTTKKNQFELSYFKKYINNNNTLNDINNENHMLYFNILFPKNCLLINCDFYIEIKYNGYKCSAWVNLFYNIVELALKNNENINNSNKNNYGSISRYSSTSSDYYIHLNYNIDNNSIYNRNDSNINKTYDKKNNDIKSNTSSNNNINRIYNNLNDSSYFLEKSLNNITNDNGNYIEMGDLFDDNEEIKDNIISSKKKSNNKINKNINENNDNIEPFDTFLIKKQKSNDNKCYLTKKQKNNESRILNLKEILDKNNINNKIWYMKLKGNDIDDFKKINDISKDFNIEIEYEIYK